MWVRVLFVFELHSNSRLKPEQAKKKRIGVYSETQKRLDEGSCPRIEQVRTTRVLRALGPTDVGCHWLNKVDD
ncbi:hypothetical protein EVAR_26414_1 [Eumeta japonica]|uniref:Uncharacterized protein n=1 Tax=Eumeta variegata TaxID=151549 RepID=A0A4C1VQ17_EUMVA|nr:hypothetical protein EVAR_26414_1 [Eumeta japonica]